MIIKNIYTVILDEIIQEIKNKENLKEKITRDILILNSTKDKLKDKQATLNEQKESYNGYVKSMLEEYSTKSRKKTNGEVKYSCRELVKKEVILIKNSSDAKQKNIYLKISETGQKGKFEAKILIKNITLDSFTISLDELLEMRDNLKHDFFLLDGRVTVKVNRFIYILNTFIKTGKKG